MVEYTAENAVEFLNLAGIFLSSNEMNIFKEEFKRYNSSEKNVDFIDTIWKVYSDILPFKTHPNEDERISYMNHIKKDTLFQEKVINSHIADKLRSGTSLSDLVKKANTFS